MVCNAVSSSDLSLFFTTVLIPIANTSRAHREFISEVQQRLNLSGQGKLHPRYMNNTGGAEGYYDAPDDSLSDDVIDSSHPVALPSPELGNLQEVDHIVRVANSTQHGRDSLSKFIIGQDYIAKLVPLVEVAEDLESLPDLHRLCNIMKIIILLNDNAIIEYIVTDEMILGVVGALECKFNLVGSGEYSFTYTLYSTSYQMIRIFQVIKQITVNIFRMNLASRKSSR